MRFNSGRPIKALTAKEQDGLREVLFPAKQPEVFAESETDDRPDPYRDPESPEERKLYPRELDEADFFEGTIDLDAVRISDRSLVGRVLAAARVAMTVENTIYGDTLMTDKLRTHELAHVWQYQNDLLSPVRAGLRQLAITALRQRNNFYEYNVEPRRKSFRDYNFEQQASILTDAYLVSNDQPPIRNRDYEGGDEPSPEELEELKELYDLFMEEFHEWHEELQPGSSSSTPSTLEEN